jgi:hypothetical protein
MGIKEEVHKLGSQHDFPILLTEELHQNYAVQGYKRKNLADVLNAFGRLSYFLEFTFPAFHVPEWKLTDAGKFQTHVRIPATIHMRLLPINPNLSSSTDATVNDSIETATRRGKAYLKQKAEKLYEQYPDDAPAICEYLGRVAPHYKNFESWQWYLCPRSGTTLNFHLQPCGIINPSFFLNAQQLCKSARINTINVYPYTIEIVFHAFSQIEHLPYNRRHRARFQPY